jgi:hypothetical protein
LVRVEEVEGPRPWNEGKRRVLVPTFRAEVDGECRLVELAGNAAVEIGVRLRAYLGTRLGPQSRAVRDLLRFGAGFSAMAIGTGTWPDCAFTIRSSVKRSV